MSAGNNRKSGLGCLSILAVIGLTAGGIYYWRGELLGKKITPLEAAEAVPQQAFLTSYISTDAQKWSQLSKFGTPEAQQVLGKKVAQFKQELSKDNINYEQDIQPWLGGVMIAVMPSNVSQNPQVLIVAGIKNKLKALDFQEKLKKQPQQTTTKTDYKGITITNITPQDNQSYSVANVSNYLLLADNNQTIQQAIDTLKGEPSYANKPGAKQVLTQSLSLENPVAQIYLTDYASVIEQGLKSASPDAPISPNTLKQLKQIESMVIGVGLEDKGIHFQAVTQLNSPESLPKLSPASGKILEQFPVQTFAFVSGQGIKEGWSNLVTQAQNDQDLQLALAQVRQGLASFNLDADKDIFAWMDGEFALGMVFTNSSSIPPLNMGGMMIWETGDRAAAENTFNKLNQLVQAYQVTVQPSQVDGINVTEWKVAPGNSLLSYGWLDNDSLAVTIAMPFATAANVKPNDSLAQSQNFEEVISSLPKKNLGYFYLDLNQAVSELTKIAQQQGTTADPETLAILNSLQGFAATATMPNKTTSQLDMLLAIKSSK